MNELPFSIKKTFLLLCVFISSLASAQTPEIGLTAQNTKMWAELMVRQGNNSMWDVKHINGKISEVIYCKNGAYDLKKKSGVDFCYHYIMKDDSINVIYLQYKNKSVNEVIESHNQSTSILKIDSYYFSNDFKYYSKVYLHDNGLATVETRSTEDGLLPDKVYKRVKSLINETNESNKKRELEKKSKEEAKNRIISKEHDLETYDNYQYSITKDDLKNGIIQYLSNETNAKKYISDQGIESLENVKVSNTYSIKLFVKDDSRDAVDMGGYIRAGSTGTKSSKIISLISGTDREKSLFKNKDFIGITPVLVEGHLVNTIATFRDVKVDLALGTTMVKVKKNQNTFYKNEPDQETQNIIANKLPKENGKYSVKYLSGNVMGDNFVTVSTTKEKRSRTKTIILGSLLLVFLLGGTSLIPQ